MPGVSVVVKNDATGPHLRGGDRRGRPLPGPGAAGRLLHRDRVARRASRPPRRRASASRPVSRSPSRSRSKSAASKRRSTVTSSAELINTETATVAATLNSDQLTRMPTPTRNALNAVTFLPGVNTTGTNRDSTINGLPESFLSITLDGVSNNDNFLRNTDGFFASVTPRQDAVEAVSVTLAAAGAQVGGGAGAVTMAFQTRSGGNRFTGSAYEYYREPGVQHELLFNEINHQGEERGQAEPVRRARRRADRDPGPLRRPQQGVLLRRTTSRSASRTASRAPARSSTRASPTAGSATSSAREVREVNLLHAGGGQRPDLGEGPDDDEAARA